MTDQQPKRRTTGPVYTCILSSDKSEFTKAYLGGVRDDLERARREGHVSRLYRAIKR